MNNAMENATRARDRADPLAAVTVEMPVRAVNCESVTETVISRRPDGSIDFDHYDLIARDLRAHDLRVVLKVLIAPVHWLLGAASPVTPTRCGSLRWLWR